MRIDQRMLEDIESLPQGVDLPLERVPEPWTNICADWFDLTASEKFDDRLLPPAAAAMYGLPLPEHMPRPGAVASWDHREWIGWATANGFEEVPRSKHAYQYRHRLVPWLLLSMSSSPGDHRWAMATATDLRFAVGAAINRLGANLYVAIQAVSANTDRHPSAAARERLRLLRTMLLAQGDRDAALRWVALNGDVPWELFDRVEPDAALVGEIRALFATLTKEFDLSPRAVLRRAGYDQDEAALLAKRLSGTTAGDVLPGDLHAEVGELLDRLREERDAAERAKQAARDARPEDAIAVAGAEAPMPTPDARAVATRQELRRRLETVRASAAQALHAVERAAADAIAAAESAVIAPADELARLRSENEALRARLAALEAAPTATPTSRKRGRARAAPESPDAPP
ncbi:MAG TPA: hypothetical protein VEL07_17225 [Planctomycetota bacterium]|nr:hypothetical protein [Planctomycetota bacterium]